MHTVKVHLKERSYKIIIGKNALLSLGKLIKVLKTGGDAFVITNSSLKSLFGKKLETALKREGIKVKFRIVPDTEKSKSIETVSLVLKDLVRFDKMRNVFIIALGGGVIGDLSGFVAAIYKRGIAYIQVPTTLLAQVDSSIGGKTGVDLAQAKNLAGAFYQPRLVLTDTNLLSTLDKRQLKAGLAEIIKYALICDAKLFAFIEKNAQNILKRDASCLERIVKGCASIKAKIVSSDEREEKGLRTVLNFGHTAGHAIEAAGDYSRYNHGEAVSLGMLIACEISKSMGLTQMSTCERIEGLLKKIGLPLRIEGVSLDAIISAHYKDKKFIGKKNRFVLIEKIGKVKIAENIPLSVIKEAVKKRLK